MKHYLPELHDIHPGMLDRLRAMAGLLPPGAAEVAPLLIVPNWQGRLPLDAAPGFAGALEGLHGARVLHGWTHSLGPSWPDWLLYGHDNRSEFARLAAAEASERLSQGQTMFARTLGAPARWFCAPRWQISRAAKGALSDRGLVGCLSSNALTADGAPPVPLPALNFDEGERRPIVALARARRAPRIARHLSTGRPFRFVIHPGDLDHPATLAQIRALRDALERDGWRPVSLDAALEAGG